MSRYEHEQTGNPRGANSASSRDHREVGVTGEQQYLRPNPLQGISGLGPKESGRVGMV